MNNLTNLAKYGLIGLCIALILLTGFVFKISMGTVDKQNVLLNNHFTDFTDAINNNTQVTIELLGEVKLLSERLR